MISPETRAQIRRYFYAEHWKIGTIVSELGVHPDTVRNAIESERFRNTLPLRESIVDPYADFIRQTLDQHPRLRATRIYQMVRDRGYTGSVVQLRRAVARLRPQVREPFLRLQVFPGEQAQADWAHFGNVIVGRARRTLSCFVMTLSYSRALYLEFFSTRPRRISCAVTFTPFKPGMGSLARFSTTISNPPCWNGVAARFISTPDCWS
jgi:transposase